MWKPIPDAPGYEVSDEGEVRSFRRGKARKLKQFARPPYGYKWVTVYRDGKRFTLGVAPLVLEAFAGPCPSGCEASHVNGVHGDNLLSNLVWEDRLTNNRRKHAHGTMVRGERAPKAKLTEAQVREILALRGASLRMIADKYGITKQSAWAIVHRKSWRHVI